MEQNSSPRVFLDIKADGRPLGRVVLELDMKRAPKTAANFLALCTGSHKHVDNRLHYARTCFHRIVPKTYVCGGDVINGNGTGGLSIYGPVFAHEKTGLKHDVPGILSMEAHGPDTSSSQFFITLQEAPWMDEFYVPFGKVLYGLDMLQKIGDDYGTESGIPKTSGVRIEACGQLTD